MIVQGKPACAALLFSSFFWLSHGALHLANEMISRPSGQGHCLSSCTDWQSAPSTARYTLKLIKSQVPYFTRQWKKNNQRIVSSIDLKVCIIPITWLRPVSHVGLLLHARVARTRQDARGPRVTPSYVRTCLHYVVVLSVNCLTGSDVWRCRRRCGWSHF
jgi:hypothetical protein